MDAIKRILKKRSFWIGFVATVIALLIILAELVYLAYALLQQRAVTDAPTASLLQDLSVYDLTAPSKNILSARDSENCVSIVCSGTAVQCDSDTVSLTDTALIISGGGNYRISGNLQNRCICVEADETAKVHLIFDGITVENPNGPAMYVRSGDKITLTLSENSQNFLTDGKAYTYTDGDTSVDAALFSKSDLVLNGKGSLTVTAQSAHGIVSKDDLILAEGSYTVTSAKAGICGKDRVKVYNNVRLSINAGTDGIRSDNSEDADRGYIDLKGATVDIVCQKDGLQAEKIVYINGTALSVKAGGGSTQTASESAKGIKAVLDVVIESGTLHVDSAEDAIHSDACVHVKNGVLELLAADDGVHAEIAVLVDGGTLNVPTEYEGLEGKYITVNGGSLHLCTADDGLNATGGSLPTLLEEASEALSFANGRLEINGGFLYVDCEGDGLDSNGILTVTGGTVLVAGPESQGNEALDCDGEKILLGGTLLLLGNAGRADNFTVAESQASVLSSVTPQAGGTTLAVCDESGTVLVSFTCPKAFCDVLFSTPAVQPNQTYRLVVNPEIPKDLPYGCADGIPLQKGTVLQSITPTDLLFGEISGGGRKSRNED